MTRQIRTDFAAYPGASARGARRAIDLLTAAFVVAGLAGCGGSDAGVSLNGKVFDVAGLTGAAKGPEPKLAERAPLVPPPRTDALPQPGTERADAGHMAWPDDPDKKRAAAATASRNV